jgi:hypothetical protein
MGQVVVAVIMYFKMQNRKGRVLRTGGPSSVTVGYKKQKLGLTTASFAVLKLDA